MEVRSERLIRTPPEQLWADLASLERWQRWMPGLKEASLLTEQSDGVGRRQRLIVEGSFGHTEIEQEIIAWEPGRRIAWRDLRHVVEGVERNFMADVTTTIELHPSERGTRVVIIGTGRPLGPLAWILNLAMARGRVKGLFDKMLENLAATSAS